MVILLGIMTFCFGLLSAAGVFTVFAAVGLVPRFAGRTHTAKNALIYENMVIAGTIVGCFCSIFERYAHVGRFLAAHFPQHHNFIEVFGNGLLVVYGIFSGMFIGCLALAIAELLDSIPIFARRLSFRHGIGLGIVGIALGKLCGSLFYFIEKLYEHSPG
ncbi:MAG: stage V sporulation protein AB [Clostridium sp.]|jgi:stage V sporulation protein AB|nr:stage V sporulation protein AB [Clostridium sp.]